MSFVSENLAGRSDLIRRAFELAGAVFNGKHLGAEYRATCPFHDDSNPSLDVNHEKGTYVCRSCSAGGDAVDFYSRQLGVTVEMAIADLREKLAIPTNGGRPGAEPSVIRTQRWEIRDSAGELVAVHIREDLSNGKKQFKWERDGKKTLGGLPAGDLPLYGSEKIAAWDREGSVLLVEGEKTADALLERGYRAVATVTGAASTPVAKAFEPLVGFDVVFSPDNDEPGRAHMNRNAETCLAIDIRPRVLKNWGEKEKGDDLADFFACGGTEEQLDLLLADAQAWGPDEAKAEPEADRAGPSSAGALKGRRYRTISMGEFLAREIPPREQVCGFLSTSTLTLVVAWRGTGKTHFALGLAIACASAGQFLHSKAPTPRRVLYIDGELPEEDLQERVRLAAATVQAQQVDPSENLRILSAAENKGAPNLATAEGRADVEEHLDGVDVLVLDSLTTLCRGGEENKAESWQPIQDWIVALRARGIAVIILHHTGKDGVTQRGTSKREDVFDWSLLLKQPADYDPTGGARFETIFTKTRHRRDPAAIAPFEAHLGTDTNGRPAWTVKPLAEARDAKIMALHTDGLSLRDIAEELKIPRSTVHRVIEKHKRSAA